MKFIALIAALSLTAPVIAQDKPAAQDAPKPAAQEPAKPTQQAAARPRKPNPNNPKRSEDARHCLEKSSNTEIIKCAEEYL